MMDLADIRIRIEEFDSIAKNSNMHQLNQKKWIEAINNNSILFMASDKVFKFKDFTYIDYKGPEIDHPEWCSQLNRFFFLRPLLSEYLRTNDEKYALLAKQSFDAYYKQENFSKNQTLSELWFNRGDNTLSMSLRLGQAKFNGWWGTIPYFEKSIHFNKELLNKIYNSTILQLDYLINNISKRGNWKVSQLDTVFYLGYIFDMPDKMNYAIKRINASLVTQIEDDGSHEEHTLGYHSWMRRVFIKYLNIQDEKPELGLEIDPIKILKMYEYEIHSYAANKCIYGLNDSLIWKENPDTKVYDKLIAQYYEMAKKYAYDPILNFDKSVYFKDANQMIFRDKKTEYIFDNSNFGGWHVHKANNSLCVYHNNKMVLIDPGSIDYDSRMPMTIYGKSTFSHNTVSVNNMSQSMSKANIYEYNIDDENINFVLSRHEGGYESDDATEAVAGMHERFFLNVRNKFSIVSDKIVSYKKNYVSRFQFNDYEYDFNKEEMSMDCEKVYLKHFYTNDNVKANIYYGDRDKPAGIIAKENEKLGIGKAAPMLEISGEGNNRTNYNMYIIIPYDKVKPKLSIKPYGNTKWINNGGCTNESSPVIAFEISINEETYIVASTYFKIDDNKMIDSIEKVGDYLISGRIAVIKKINNIEKKRWII